MTLPILVRNCFSAFALLTTACRHLNMPANSSKYLWTNVSTELRSTGKALFGQLVVNTILGHTIIQTEDDFFCQFAMLSAFLIIAASQCPSNLQVNILSGLEYFDCPFIL
jgi:hypothetical protein